MRKVDEAAVGTVALTRGLEAVRLLANQGPLSVAELSERLAIRREAGDRIVNTLLGLGFIQETSHADRYVPAPLVHRLTSRYLESLTIIAVVRPFLQGLAERQRVKSRLVVKEGEQAVCLIQLSHGEGLRSPSGNRSVPLHQSLAGRAIMSIDDETGKTQPNRTHLENYGYLIESDPPRWAVLAMPVRCGEASAAIEVSLDSNASPGRIQQVADDLVATALLLQEGLPNAGIRSIEL